MSVEDVYDKFMDNLDKSETANNILDFEYDSQTVSNQNQAKTASSLYQPKHSFFEFFQDLGGVAKLFSVAI